MSRHHVSTGTMALVCVLISSCIEGFDNFNGSDEAYYRLFDYEIDRPRVLAVTWWPPAVSGGEVVTFQALAATPDDPVSSQVSWWACGLSLDVPFTYYGADCMQTSLAEYLGTGPTLTVTLPDYDTATCQESGNCYGYIPVIAVVRDRTGEQGQGMTFLTPDYTGRAPEPRMDWETWNVALQLWIGGVPGGPAPARPGDTVPLEAVLPSVVSDCEFSWYTTAGVLMDYGVTRAAEVSTMPGGQAYRVTGRNTLIVPEDAPASIQVYVVTTPPGAGFAFLPRFATGRVEVTP